MHSSGQLYPNGFLPFSSLHACNIRTGKISHLISSFATFVKKNKFIFLLVSYYSVPCCLLIMFELAYFLFWFWSHQETVPRLCVPQTPHSFLPDLRYLSLLWFTNYIPQFSVPSEILQITHYLATSSAPSPFSRLNRVIGGSGWISGVLRTIYQKQQWSKKQTRAIWIIECTREVNNPYTIVHPLENSSNIQPLPPPCYTTQRSLLPRFSKNDRRWYGITFGPWPCPLLATAKIIPVVAVTRASLSNASWKL